MSSVVFCCMNVCLCVGCFIFSTFLVFLPVHAQTSPATTVAGPVVVSGDIHDGDILSFDHVTNTYHASQISSDPSMVGVVVFDPVLYMQDSIVASGTRPVVRYGEVLVNVSDLNGLIQAGDLITSSPIVGLGQRVDGSSATYVLGVALAEPEYQTESVEVQGEMVRVGRVAIMLRVGPHINIKEDGDGVDDTGTFEDLLSTLQAKIKSLEDQQSKEGGVNFYMLARYALGALVAFASVVLALRRFGELLSQSVISVGRNPLARSQIRSLLVWNALLIIAVSGVGLGIGMAIIFV